MLGGCRELWALSSWRERKASWQGQQLPDRYVWHTRTGLGADACRMFYALFISWLSGVG